MSFWPLLGFKQSPYATNPVPSDEDGEKLLVGREAEVDDLVELVSGTTGHAVVGGANGVGKSSLIAVVTHQLRQIDEGPSGPLFLSLRRPINVSPSSTTESIREEATLMLAQGLIDHQQTLRRAGRRLPDLEPLEHWLNSPTVKGRGGGVTTPLGGLNASTSETVNAGQGFSRLGVFDLVLEGVRASASADQSGGFVAVLDNLELCGTVSQSRSLVEGCRDPLFTIPGLRWIICGAGGIAYQLQNSKRLNGIVSHPITVTPIAISAMPEVIDKRIECYRTRPDPTIPVDGQALHFLFERAHGNLRTALSHSERFSSWAYQRSALPEPGDSTSAVREWLRAHAQRVVSNGPAVSSGAWELLREIADSGGVMGSLDDAVAGVRELEERGWIAKVTAEDPAQTAIFELTDTGWLAHAAP